MFKILMPLVLLLTFTAHISSQQLSHDTFICKMCHKFQSLALDLKDKHFDQILEFAKTACKIKGSEHLCEYYVKLFGKALVDNKISFYTKTDFVCSKILKVCPNQFSKFNIKAYKKSIYNRYPKPTKVKVDNKANFTAVVLNDIHIQLSYTEKAETKCSEVQSCCSAQFGFPTDPNRQAGYWGTDGAGCDIPVRTFENTANWIRDNMPTPDLVFLLGDNVSHDYHLKNETEIITTTKLIFDKIKQNFPNSLIVPVLGNHECHFVDNLNYEDKNNWLYEHIYPLYETLIPKEKIQNLKDKSLYSLEKEEFNLKIVSLNSQFYDGFNAFLADQTEIMWGFLEELINELYESEKKGQNAVILSHIPISVVEGIKELDSCLKIILERFQHTIIGFFSGHTHQDEVRFIRDSQDKVFMANYISPSLTTDCVNPSFRVYRFGDGKLLNLEQHSLDLTLHNQKALNSDFSVEFYKAYDFLNEYELTDLSMDSLGDLHTRFQTKDEKTLRKYVAHAYCHHKDDNYSDRVDYLVCMTNDSNDEIIACLWKHKKQFVKEDFVFMLFQKLFYHPLMLKNKVIDESN